MRVCSSVTFHLGRNLDILQNQKTWNNFNCSLFFSKQDCKVDPRQGFIHHYHLKSEQSVYLIVVNFHWNIFNALPFLRDKYFPRFHQLFNSSFDVVYLAPTYKKSLTVVKNGLPNAGHYSYYTLSRAYEIFRSANEYDYAGYFLINDDSFIDPLHLNKISLNESFCEPSGEYSVNKTSNWFWNTMFKNVYGMPFSDAYYASIEELKVSRFETICNFSNPLNHRKGFYDFAYITGKDISMYYELSSVFFKHRAFLEVAGPTMNWCLSHKVIDSCNHRGWKNVKTCAFLHPVKLSAKENEQLVLDHINRINVTKIPKMSY